MPQHTATSYRMMLLCQLRLLVLVEMPFLLLWGTPCALDRLTRPSWPHCGRRAQDRGLEGQCVGCIQGFLAPFVSAVLCCALLCSAASPLIASPPSQLPSFFVGHLMIVHFCPGLCRSDAFLASLICPVDPLFLLASPTTADHTKSRQSAKARKIQRYNVAL